jgi:hypothetical protein
MKMVAALALLSCFSRSAAAAAAGVAKQPPHIILSVIDDVRLQLCI